MALVPLVAGSVAKSAVLNDNFNYLDEKVSTTNSIVGNHSSQLSALNTNVTLLTNSLSSSIPTGTILTLPYRVSALNGYLICDGSEVSIADFPALYEVIGTTYGGDGNTKFNLPNFQGAFLRGYGSQTIDERIFASNEMGEIQLDEIKSHAHPAHYHGGNHQHGPTSDSVYAGPVYSGATGATGGDETRPLNCSVLYLIKY